MKKFNDPHNKHLRRYLFLTLTIFSIVTASHLVLIMKDLNVSVGIYELPIEVNYAVFFVLVMMIIMGIYYYRATKK